ncbi:unnamed protein product [Amaranthus hypochondriacus]
MTYWYFLCFFSVYHKRGPSRGLKSRRWREKHPTQKPFATISEDMRRVVGERAAEFISDCSRWVREYCTLKTRNWVGMDRECKERLYSKIQGEWDLPKFVDGINVKVALSCQCAALYRGWRHRLKEKYFIGYSIAAAKANKPPEIDVNQWNWCSDLWWLCVVCGGVAFMLAAVVGFLYLFWMCCCCLSLVVVPCVRGFDAIWQVAATLFAAWMKVNDGCSALCWLLLGVNKCGALCFGYCFGGLLYI